MRGGKRDGAGRPTGSTGIQKTKLKAPEALKVTKGIRYTPEQIERIHEAARKLGSKNFSQFVVMASVEKAEAVLNKTPDGEQSLARDPKERGANSDV